jgi:hypothetical protein
MSVGVLVASCRGTTVSMVLEDHHLVHPHLTESSCCFAGLNILVCVNANDDMIALLFSTISFFQ